MTNALAAMCIALKQRSQPRVTMGGTQFTAMDFTVEADMRDTAAMIGFMALMAALIGSFIGVAYGVAALISQTITAALAGVI